MLERPDQHQGNVGHSGQGPSDLEDRLRTALQGRAALVSTHARTAVGLKERSGTDRTVTEVVTPGDVGAGEPSAPASRVHPPRRWVAAAAALLIVAGISVLAVANLTEDADGDSHLVVMQTEGGAADLSQAGPISIPSQFGLADEQAIFVERVGVFVACMQSKGIDLTASIDEGSAEYKVPEGTDLNSEPTRTYLDECSAEATRAEIALRDEMGTATLPPDETSATSDEEESSTPSLVSIDESTASFDPDTADDRRSDVRLANEMGSDGRRGEQRLVSCSGGAGLDDVGSEVMRSTTAAARRLS